MSRLIAISIEDEVQVHAAASPTGNYDTLCGVDKDDPSMGHKPAPLPKGAKIDCTQCVQTIRTAKKYGERDFKK